MYCFLETTFDIFAIIAVIQLMAKIGIIVWIYFYEMHLGYWLKQNVNLRSVGKWAVVAGPSSDLGRAYAQEMARLGFDLVLIDDSEENVEILSKSIVNDYNIRVEFITVDYTTDTESTFQIIRKQLDGKEIGILINAELNGYTTYPEYFCKIPNLDAHIRNIIKTNCQFTVMMCKTVLISMIERRKGVILNVVSPANKAPMPFFGVFDASKSFLENITIHLGRECKIKGVVVQLVSPFSIASERSGQKKSAFVPTAKEFVQSQVKTAGLVCQTHGYWSHALQGIYHSLVKEYNLLWWKNYSLDHVKQIHGGFDNKNK